MKNDILCKKSIYKMKTIVTQKGICVRIVDFQDFTKNSKIERG